MSTEASTILYNDRNQDMRAAMSHRIGSEEVMSAMSLRSSACLATYPGIDATRCMTVLR